MKQLLSLFITIILTASYAHSQVKSGPPAVPETRPVHIIYADKLRTEKLDSVREIQTGSGKVQAEQGNTLFECDSFYYDKSTKIFEAFGNVHINDNDSINIYSKYLLYHVDTRIANLKNNVRLTDGKSTLTTQQLDYDLNQKIGNYYNGGKVLNEKSVLTSTEATYFANTKDVYFKKKVVLIDPQYELRADSLLYNSQTQLTTFITKTYIKDSARNIETSSGHYDLKNKKATFGKRPTINDGSSQVIADDIDTNDSTGISILTGNVLYKDTAQGYAMRGNFMHVNNKEGTLLATRNAVLIIKQDKDSLFVTGDTLFSGKLSLLKLQVDSINKKNSSGRDSVSLKNDSIKNDLTKTPSIRNDSTKSDSTKI
ncbi:MAG TPA: OstA-like protein, partial [Flavitalea sp.]|nr:OstA-like protein [Flavitalea sp.]